MSDSTRQRLLEAAADHFRNPDYSILSDVTIVKIAQRAGVPEATARRHFLVEELHAELIDYMLSPNERAGKGFGGLGWNAEVQQEAANRLSDRDTNPGEAIQAVMGWLWPGNIEDPQLRSQMALWPYAADNRQIAERMTELYEWFEAGIRQIFSDFVTRHSHVVSLRQDWISIEDFALIVNQLAETVAIRASLHQATGCTGFGFDPKTPGRALLALAGSMIIFHDEDEHPLDRQYREIHERR